VTRLPALVIAAVLVLVCAAPAAADPDGQVDLTVIATVEESALLPDEKVMVEVKVVNLGTATATGVKVRSTGDLELGPWDEFDPSGHGVELSPSEGVTLIVGAPPTDTGEIMTQLLEAVSAEPDGNLANNRAKVEAFVTAETVDLTLVPHFDGDGDGVMDPGETMVGVQVKVTGGRKWWEGQARTDANGAIHFAGIPGGEYSIDASVPTGWHLDEFYKLRLRPGHNEIAVRVQLIDITKLVATIAFDKPVYAVGDTVRQKVTLTNTGRTDLTGLVAQCGTANIQIGDSTRHELNSSGWGELDPAELGAGATVRAGETRTWEFTDPVTQRMWDFGFVLLECDFVVRGTLVGAHARARSEVPGGVGTAAGLVVHEDQPKPGITLLLFNEKNGKVAARAVSDGAGRFAFPALPAGAYEMRPLGPWKLMDRVYGVQILARNHHDLHVALIPGPVYLDPEAPPQPEEPAVDDVAPTPQASPVRHPGNLAYTGTANVVELVALGALLMVVGMLLVRRRSLS
jgi:LPXTG-motif cell wall-anchored protein